MTGRAEGHRRTGVQIRRDQEQFWLELAKFVGSPGCREQAAEEMADRARVEHADRDGVSERRERLHHPPAQRVAQALPRRLHQ
jgi:hypothetical protein